MIVIVCGSRGWTDSAKIKEVLAEIEPDIVIAGGARGADRLGAQAARDLGIKVEEYPVTSADWQREGKRAGLNRNYLMLNEGKPDIVLAFWDGQSRGTKHMIDISREKGVEVEVYQNLTE